MPIYEYACEDCGNEFEMLVRSHTVPACPICESTSLEKQLSVIAKPEGSAAREPVMAGPCGTCGHPDGPGACHLQ